MRTFNSFKLTIKKLRFCHKNNLLMVYQIISQKKDIAGGKGVMNIRKQTETDRLYSPRAGFNGSVNISESCGFRSQFEPLYIIF